MSIPRDYDVRNQVVSLDRQIELGNFGLECLMRKSPKAVVITESEKAVAVVVHQNRGVSLLEGKDSDYIQVPTDLIAAWLQMIDGTLSPFVEMAAINQKPLSIDLGENVGRVLLIPVGDKSFPELECAIPVSKDERVEFKYYLAKDFLKEVVTVGRELSFDEYQDRLDCTWIDC